MSGTTEHREPHDLPDPGLIPERDDALLALGAGLIASGLALLAVAAVLFA